MIQSTPVLVFLATLLTAKLPASDPPAPLSLPPLRPDLERLAHDYLRQPIAPQATFDYEREVEKRLREYGRKVVAATYHAAAAQLDTADPRVRFAGEDYRRLNAQSRNTHVYTSFGTIALKRHMYRCCDKHSGLSCRSPAEMALGLMEGATPAFAEAATRYFAEAGATQASVLQRLKESHGVSMGVKKLRNLAAKRAEIVAESQSDRLANRLLELLERADASRGTHKPVLSVGRDGVTLREYRHRFFEVASVGTLAVYDRRGMRLGTVYLGCVPESKQVQLSTRLDAILQEVLRRWEGRLPRLSYVTDAGDNETNYYRDVLRPMKHPRTGEALQWVRVVDFYHAMERVWTISRTLFGDDERAGVAWARRMGKLLKTPNGPFRVLHAAAAMKARRAMSKVQRTEYAKAYEYLRVRTQWMQYANYQRVGVPLGSGVTEAACKTLVAQRLKLSGMRWKKPGSQAILDLRSELLSGTWAESNRHVLAKFPQVKRVTPADTQVDTKTIAA